MKQTDTRADKSAERFFGALRDVFVGAPVEGQSGFINLMRIKSRYYTEGVFPRLQKDIEQALKPFPGFRQELFDKLYDFFHRYFSPSGSIYFQHTPAHKNIYEKVYTDDRDVVLFWKTHMLYYVKTDRLFNSLEVEVDDRKFFFDASTLEHKRANEKRELVYEFKEKRDDGVLVFSTAYSEKGRKTKLDDILRELHRLGVEVKEEAVERAFRVFERQSEVDYFINKNAKAFLREQFDLWLFQYVFSGESEWTEQRIKQLQVLKDIALKVIDFIRQFEDELVRIWNKPKFVLNSNYVITLDRIAGKDMALVERLLKHEGMKAQIQEWRDLGIVGDDFRKTQILESTLQGKEPAKQWRFLPFDTKLFKDLELEILGLFDHLDDELDGWLIKSENYQALKTLERKWSGRVDCVYIDPPYNAEGSEILYVNDYKSSSWLSMMQNRLAITSTYFTDESTLAIAVDDFEMSKLRELIRQMYPGWESSTIVVNHHPQGSPRTNVSRTHEYLLVATPEGTDLLRVARQSDKKDERPFKRSGTGENNYRRGRWKSFYAILIDPAESRVVGIEPPPPLGTPYPTEPTKSGFTRVYPIDGSGEERVWRKTYKSAATKWQSGEIFCRGGKSGPMLFERVVIERVKPTSNWFAAKFNAGPHGSTLLANLFGDSGVFLYPKSLYSVLELVDAATFDNQEAIIFDYFGGSATSAHAVIELNRQDGGSRKYILVEMAEYFDTVVLPRVKKVAFCKDWKDGKAAGGAGVSHFVKYFQLEQYEDCLRRAKYEEADLFDDPNQDPYNQYVFLRDPKLLDAVKVDTKKNEVQVDLSRLYKGVDLPETLSNLTGKRIRRIKPDSVEFEDGTVIDLTKQGFEFFKLIKPMVWW
jgi:hypothetical protein